ncbi:bifunctional 2-C-methyl-D-erythritol 4-phosphate cytidylyltransferase/2-C-methyl-D-erythritol 2,4-cyclodiphosphate synthase [Prosthecomicrobium pneumaticum]|uniref:Bifunctional enzyme IspD/IspF n=1 Tax=Prosthecomicrobium pneumaticum TaxID=81895 RepID=A0A7W9CSN0_9HYPH|nr:bifunctional 2-C-methyl-D-erythritol 4-phosphate cytidylyltransferase/2-C-methyl-D-erythritol 2,4-cyclodiphosphate synthase [Prosthecomicrobium pneumaticum]MBB5751160.1 2-C-methyl-D-erythritol 4-phosphate cytidylyltransferase/2-C-methyl-D-erythritol 2,4-cyclodiphosphate synthase [Prosthecomicrobium pneumaticum]
MLQTKPAVLIVAAGRGVRAGGAVPKQYQRIGGRAILARTVEIFMQHEGIGPVLVAIGAEDGPLYDAAVGEHPRLLPPVKGGATRQETVLRGLEALAAEGATHVLVHDGVRPFASAALIGRVIAALEGADAVLPATPVTDTLKRADGDGRVIATVDRGGLFGAQTPQGFRLETLLAAHRGAAAAGLAATDDAAVMEWAGVPVTLVPGEAENVKLTTPADIAAAGRRLRQDGLLILGETRVGTGYDIHPFTDGDTVHLGGVPIPHDRRLAGHSDADVALHALTDALLGALAEGDIGDHFPPSDPQWKGASSDRFLAFAAERVRARGGVIAHLDLAIVAEAPRIGPHRTAMRARIAAICGIGADRVGVKATTNEKLGALGRGEGIAAIATATIRLPYPVDPPGEETP